MNFQQLTYILAVDRYRHFAQAAAHCHVTQATLSAMIKKLEEELGVVVFDRTRQPVKTTEDGQEVLRLARQLINRRDELLTISSRHLIGVTGELTVGIIPTVANALLPLLFKVWISKYPELRLRVTEVTTEQITEQLVNDQIDAGILATPLGDDDLEEVILYYETMMVYGVSDGRRSFIAPKDLENSKIWLLEEGHCFRNQSLTICNMKERKENPTPFQFEGRSFDTLLQLTDAFGGYTLLPELYVQGLTDERKARTCRFQKPYPVREISLVYQRPYVKQRSLAMLADVIREVVVERLQTSGMKPKDLSIIGI